MAKRGIDISTHNGNIDLNALKNQIDFVIIRVGYGTKGTIDPKFRRNADLCKQLGIPFGFYWYSYALNEYGAEQEANAFLNAIAPYKDSYSYGCWFDMEDADGYKRKNGMPSNSTLRAICNRFCSIVQSQGYYVGIYASSSWFANQLAGPEINKYDKWVAQWPTSGGRQRGLNVQASERTDKTMWQFTSMARFSGYNGNLDANYAYIDYPALIRGIPSQGGEVQPPVIPSKSNEQIAEEVKAGMWGNGQDRENALRAAGYDYNAIQALVNQSYGGNATHDKTYTVKSGDNLSKIASQFGMNWKDLAALNNIAGPKYLIYPGQVLKITGSTSSNTSSNTSTSTYTVKSGDTLSGIGNKLEINWKDLANINDITSPYTIYPGQVLKIKGSTNNTVASKTYTVKSGDTLSGIGAKLGVNWKDLAAKNGINSPYTIYPGQTLKY